MHILVTNDDGLWAQGIQALVAAIPAENKISVVAPASPQSAKGHSLTMHKPLRITSVENYVHPGVDAWSVSGTPVDCMMLALDMLVKEKVDIVFSGINHGDNLGDDLPYSGTVSGAYEAFLSGCPSVAFSTAFPRAGSSGFDFSPITWFLQKMLPLIPELIGLNQPLTKSFSRSLNGSLFLNANAPNCPASGVAVDSSIAGTRKEGLIMARFTMLDGATTIGGTKLLFEASTSPDATRLLLSLIHISEPTRLGMISY